MAVEAACAAGGVEYGGKTLQLTLEALPKLANFWDGFPGWICPWCSGFRLQMPFPLGPPARCPLQPLFWLGGFPY